jgi:PAS domain S-box-containing protein
MKSRSEDADPQASLREKLVGLGESSTRKTYYPELQRRLEELSESEAFLKNIVDNIPAMVFVKDAADLNYVAFNKAGEELLGYSGEEMLGKNDYDFFPAEQAAFFIQKDREVLTHGHLLEIAEETIKTRDGRELILHTKKIPLYDSRGNARYLLGISEDITERKLLEAQLLQSQKMEAVGHLASGIAHDFNNILMVIMGYGDVLTTDRTLDEQQQHKVAQIVDAAEKASQLTRNLLAFGRKQQIKPRLADINDIVCEIQKFLLRIIGEDIQLRTDCAPEALLALVDSSQIEQVIINLATNARDAMPKGGLLSIETRLHQVDQPSAPGAGTTRPMQYACISVTDTGTGMDEKTKGRIFEPFFTTKDLGKGTGLGMPIINGIIKQHNGFIDIRSELGAGTTFMIYIPLAKRQTAEAAKEPAPVVPPKGHGETILVAEDDAAVRELVQMILKKNGYEVLLAGDGQDAVEMFSSEHSRIRLVLMDLIMPRMNGREASIRMRKIAPGVPIIYTSGYTRDLIASRDAQVEEGNLLEKPIQPRELLQQVHEALDR